MAAVKGNQSVARAFAIIEYLAAQGKPVRLLDVARDLELDHATAHRFLSSLRQLGYVHHAGESGYQLTLKFARITSMLLDAVQVRGLAHVPLTELTAQTGETCHLAILDGTHAIYIDKVDGGQAVSMRSRIGSQLSLHSTAIGKVILAYLPAADRARLLDSISLDPLTSHTITHRKHLEEHLQTVRQSGFARDDEENEIGIRCVAAPILDAAGAVVAAVSVSGWIVTMTPDRASQLAKDVIQTCSKISSNLGPAVALV